MENSLIYVCSDDNEKAIQRHKIFDRWYKKSVHKKSVMKIDNIITVEIDAENIQTLYTSFLFHKDNPAYEKLISIYHKIEEALNRDK